MPCRSPSASRNAMTTSTRWASAENPMNREAPIRDFGSGSNATKSMSSAIPSAWPGAEPLSRHPGATGQATVSSRRTVGTPAARSAARSWSACIASHARAVLTPTSSSRNTRFALTSAWPLEHPAQRHPRNAQPRSCLCHAQPELGQHVLSEDLPRVYRVLHHHDLSPPVSGNRDSRPVAFEPSRSRCSRPLCRKLTITSIM